MATLRCFFAIELPTSLQAAIAGATSEARTGLGQELVRWVPRENVHLTLKFLGDTTPAGLQSVRSAMAHETARHTSFRISVGGLGVFPSSHKPRVVWIGLTAPQELITLQRDLDGATARLGYASDERDFSPHLTIGRVRQHLPASGLKTIRDVLAQTTIGELGAFIVERVVLFQSELLPVGSRYTALDSAPLTTV